MQQFTYLEVGQCSLECRKLASFYECSDILFLAIFHYDLNNFINKSNVKFYTEFNNFINKSKVTFLYHR